jgi:hypothetical protein
MIDELHFIFAWRKYQTSPVLRLQIVCQNFVDALAMPLAFCFLSFIAKKEHSIANRSIMQSDTFCIGSCLNRYEMIHWDSKRDFQDTDFLGDLHSSVS